MYLEILSGVLNQNRRSIAKAITHVENNTEISPKLLSDIYKSTGNSYRIGITGPPGAGKSSLTDKLIKYFRTSGKSVGVVLIDPSSPYSGGAILGDRIRMIQHYDDEKVFIRSMASRGGKGGLAQSSKEVGDILDAAGFDIIIFETVGVGQVELDVVQTADTVIVVLVPESGDDIQMMKAGLMEIADIFVINKSDRPDSNKLYVSITNMLSVIAHDDITWIPKITKTIANKENGISDLMENIELHNDYINKSDILTKKNVERYKSKVKDIIITKQLSSFWTKDKINVLEKELSKPNVNRKSPYELVEKLYLDDI